MIAERATSAGALRSSAAGGFPVRVAGEWVWSIAGEPGVRDVPLELPKQPTGMDQLDADVERLLDGRVTGPAVADLGADIAAEGASVDTQVAPVDKRGAHDRGGELGTSHDQIAHVCAEVPCGAETVDHAGGMLAGVETEGGAPLASNGAEIGEYMTEV